MNEYNEVKNDVFETLNPFTSSNTYEVMFGPEVNDPSRRACQQAAIDEAQRILEGSGAQTTFTIRQVVRFNSTDEAQDYMDLRSLKPGSLHTCRESSPAIVAVYEVRTDDNSGRYPQGPQGIICDSAGFPMQLYYDCSAFS